MKYEKAKATIVQFNDSMIFMRASQGRIDRCTAYKAFTAYHGTIYDCFAVSQSGTTKMEDGLSYPWIHCTDVEPPYGPGVVGAACKVWS